MFLNRLKKLGEHPLVGEARGVGLIGALEVVADKQSSRGKSSPLKVAQKPPAFTIAGQAVSKKVRRKHRLAQLQNVDRDIVLAGLDRSLPKKPTERREALKRLVLDKILLQTGAIDIGHPAVAAWLKTGREKIKNHAR